MGMLLGVCEDCWLAGRRGWEWWHLQLSPTATASPRPKSRHASAAPIRIIQLTHAHSPLPRNLNAAADLRDIFGRFSADLLCNVKWITLM